MYELWYRYVPISRIFENVLKNKESKRKNLKFPDWIYTYVRMETICLLCLLEWKKISLSPILSLSISTLSISISLSLCYYLSLDLSVSLSCMYIYRSRITIHITKKTLSISITLSLSSIFVIISLSIRLFLSHVRTHIVVVSLFTLQKYDVDNEMSGHVSDSCVQHTYYWTFETKIWFIFDEKYT